MLKETLPASPTIYKVAAGKQYNQLQALAVWSNPDMLPKNYTAFTSYNSDESAYVVSFNIQTKTADTYLLATGGDGLKKVNAASCKGAYIQLSTAAFNNNQYILGYDAASGAFDFYQVGTSQSLNPIYSFAGPTSLTTASLFTYRGALYFVGYNTNTGAVAYYQVTASGSGITAAQIWSDTWAQGWTRFTFFQMALENFFFKTNTKYVNCNIDHIMDDPSTGSHPVGTKLPLSQNLTVVQAFYFAGDVYFATYLAADGSVTLNRFLASGQGWAEGASFATFKQGSAVVPLYQGTDTYLLFY